MGFVIVIPWLVRLYVEIIFVAGIPYFSGSRAKGYDIICAGPHLRYFNCICVAYLKNKNGICMLKIHSYIHLFNY